MSWQMCAAVTNRRAGLGFMKLLFLSSNAPRLDHFRAGETIVALIARQLRELGHTVELGLLRANRVDEPTRAALEHEGITLLPSFDSFLVVEPPASRSLPARFIRGGLKLFGRNDSDPPLVRGKALAQALDARGADAAILFWDTTFEKALPWLKTPSVGYLARPPTASELARIENSKVPPPIKLWRRLGLLAAQRRHFARMRYLTKAVNICALDAVLYTNQGVPSGYLSNTWMDPFGDNWRSARVAAEGRRSGIHILTNIGGLSATGNLFGLTYFADHVLPLLESKIGGQAWTANICGRFELPRDLGARLVHPNVAIRGFVDDIDEEVAGNAIFLLLNNAGPYTGGYTRVIYAMATGSCLVAHRRLAASMPELVDGVNCLFGDEPEDFKRLLQRAASDPVLRQQLGERARLTFETSYHPAMVASRLSELSVQAAA